ncbi:hypothetical protein ACX80N_07410 [Arthrobacter sp. MDT2-16]
MDTENRALDVQGYFTLPLDVLREAPEGTLPKHFGQRAGAARRPRTGDAGYTPASSRAAFT